MSELAVTATMACMDTFSLQRGTVPLLISLPHDGSFIPADIAARMHPAARRSPDTDWHMSRLYEFARGLGASMIVPVYSRYVVDLNRSSEDVSLYPGQNTTGLCPTVQFSGEPVYRDGQEPDADEIAQRVETFWQPYHQALTSELSRLRAQFGRVVLWEGHSIRSHLPFLFEGRLPVFNLGTASGNACSQELARQLTAVLSAQRDYDHVVDGRFKGGYITRHYGRPTEGVDAVQLELAQRAYMDESDFAWRQEKASFVQPIIAAMLNRCLEFAR